MAGIDEYTSVLLHCDGTDESTTVAEEISDLTITVSNASIDTAESKFGGASLRIDASDYISIPAGQHLNFGTDDFTIDFWIKNPNPSSNGYYFLMGSWVQYLYWEVNSGNYGYTWGGQDKNTYHADVYSAFNTDWQHIALVSTGNEFRIYVDGVQKATSSTTSAQGSATDAFKIGHETYGDNFWIDEFRVSKGVARWTDTFTPPTEAYSEEATSAVKSANGLARASVKSVQGLAIASVKSINNLA